MSAHFCSGQTGVLQCHVMPIGPKRFFAIDLHVERGVYKLVDTFF